MKKIVLIAVMILPSIKKTIFFSCSLLLFACCLLQTATAQPFIADKYGYVQDPKFHELIKAKGYELVGTYDSIGNTVRADVYYNGEWRYIDQYGELIAKKEKKEDSNFDRIREINVGDAGWDIVAVPPDDYKLSNLPEDEYEVFHVDGKGGTKHKLTGKIGLEPIYDMLTLYSGTKIIGIEKDGKHGMAYSNGKVFIAPEYEEVSTIFSYTANQYSAFRVEKDKKYGLIDSLGKILLNTEYEMLSSCNNCIGKEKLLIAKKNGKYGIITDKKTQIVEHDYDEIIVFIGSLMKVKSGTPTKYGIINCKGKLLLDSQDKITYDYNEGLISFEKDGLIGKMKPDGTILFHQYYTSIINANKEYVTVLKDRKYGLLNKKEKYIVPPIYNEIWVMQDWGLISVGLMVDTPYRQQKKGFLDMKGNVVINIVYDCLERKNDNLFYFEKQEKYGLMDQKERVQKYFNYERVNTIGAFYRVEKNNKEGIVDIDDNILLPIKYEFIKDGYDFYKNGYCRVRLNGQYYLADRYGNELLRKW